MPQEAPGLSPELAHALSEVARQIRRKQWTYALFTFAACSLAAAILFTGLLFVLLPMGVDRTQIVIAFLLVETIAAVLLVVRPLRRPVPMREVALFVDQHQPQLQNRIISAFEFSDSNHEGVSDWLVERLLEETQEHASRLSYADFVSTRNIGLRGLAAYSMILAALLVIGGFNRLWVSAVWFGGEEEPIVSTLLQFIVEPGDIRIRRGDNQLVSLVSKKGGKSATIRFRTKGASWQTASMQAGASDGAHFHQFSSVNDNVEYQVQYGWRRSDIYTISTWIPPEVEAIDLTYNYPEYLEQERREVPNSGNITAVEGTHVELAVWINKKVAKATLVTDSGKRIKLAANTDAQWTGNLKVLEDDVYHIEIVDEEGQESEYNPDYTIESLPDNPPEIHIDFPRKDIDVTLLEEVPFTFSVSDDFGLADFGLQYEIAGQEPVQIPMDALDPESVQADGDMQLDLEDFGLTPGDLVTWTVWAKDRRPDRSKFELYGDPYFLAIRPFRKTYRESVSNAGAGAGMQNDDSGDQKQIIIAVWNLRARAHTLNEEEFDDTRGKIIEAQQELLRKYVEMLTQPRAPTEIVGQIVLDMRAVIKALKDAELPDPSDKLSECAGSGQSAYSGVLKLRPEETEISTSQGAGGGNLAEIEELETERNRNFYEEERKPDQEEKAAEEMVNALRELAQRQEMLNEELAKLVSEREKDDAESKRDQQRMLERLKDEAEANLERLDELSSEMAAQPINDRQARDAQKAIEDARRQMNRNLEFLRENMLQEARSAGTRALDAIEDIENELQNYSRNASAERMRDLQDRMKELAKDGDDMLKRAGEMRDEHDRPTFDTDREHEARRTQMIADKERMAEEFVDIMQEAGELADRSNATQELMSRKLGDWLRQTARETIEQDIEDSEALVEHGFWDPAVELETRIQQKLAQASMNLDEVADSLVEDDLEGLRKAYDRLAQLMEGQMPGGQDPLGQGQQPGEEGDQTGPGGEPQEDGQPGQAPGEQPGQGQAPGEQPGQGQAPGEQPGQGQAPGEQPGQGQAPGEQPGQGQQGTQPGQQPGQGQQGGQPGQSQGQSSRGSRQFGGASGPGGSWDPTAWSNSLRPWSPGDLRDFAENDYRDWLETIRDAQALLPENSDQRIELQRIEEQIEDIRGTWRRRSLTPRYNLVLDQILKPLGETAKSLALAIQMELDAREFILADDGDVPPRYRKQVAEYFKALSQAEDDRT